MRKHIQEMKIWTDTYDIDFELLTSTTSTFFRVASADSVSDTVTV